jgi:hypothetical protein
VSHDSTQVIHDIHIFALYLVDLHKSIWRLCKRLGSVDISKIICQENVLMLRTVISANKTDNLLKLG